MNKIDIDKIIRTNRRTFSLQVAHDATLTVRVPMHAKIKLIEKIVAQKASWITKKQEEALQRKKNIPKRKFDAGEIFHYLGDGYPLYILDGAETLTFDGNRFLLSPKDTSRERDIFIEWYKKEAISYITDRVDYYAKEEGLDYNRIRISKAKKRWGSCSSKGNLNFSWRLILAPPAIVDYIVVHELAHLKHKNHAASFWSYVEQILPNYRKAKSWLKANGHLLNI